MGGNDKPNIIDNYNSLQQVKDELIDSHKSAKLSPFVCRIKEGKYSFGGRDFEFTNKFPDGSAIHGLLVKKSFEIVLLPLVARKWKMKGAGISPRG